ncbi:MAG: cytochrome c3 family protein [Deltaproteobacteria bacterium]|nr:cytochrome c3 family protein [Deltaproteobacteria bacterium]MBW2446898.1 cytochrome c3 family protein [Deltaproteobacteria bacterium]
MTRRTGGIFAAGLLVAAWLVAPGAPVRAGDPVVAEEALPPPSWDRGLSDLISPGPLARAHLDLEGVTNCNDCHSWLGGTPDAACLECHGTVGERMADRVGFHGGFEGACAGCHADHRGREADLLGLDREGFAHDLALFTLRGAHAAVTCDDCHQSASPEPDRRDAGKGFHPIGIARDCVGCHESPHARRLTRERSCEACHVAASWDVLVPVDPAEGLGFDHEADTRFPLDALHGALPCVSCHEPEGQDVPARECATCHPDAASLLAGRFGGREAEPDPHAATTACGECHPAAMTEPSLPNYATICTDCHPASYAPLLATRRALLDEALVAARLVTQRSSDRRRLERITRSGLHHPELAEALALELARPKPR